MRGTLVIAGDQAAPTISTDPDAADVTAALHSGARFWLDLLDPGPGEFDLLREAFGFHPLAVEDAEHFGQRAKIDIFDDFALIVAYGVGGAAHGGAAHGATARGGVAHGGVAHGGAARGGTARGGAADPPGVTAGRTEVHFFLTGTCLVTVRRAELSAIDAVRTRISAEWKPATDGRELTPIAVFYRILDGIVDDYFPYLDAFDDSIDALQDEILRAPTDAQLGQLFDMKRHLIAIRRLTAEQRDMMEEAVSGARPLPGMTPEIERYLRDVHDHLSRLAQTADGYRDLLSSALDTHLSTTSNRLNTVMKQLAIIATVFLPMSFLTGFFGQNFGWLVDRIGGSAVFWTVGVGVQVAVAAGLLLMFRRMGWLGDRSNP